MLNQINPTPAESDNHPEPYWLPDPCPAWCEEQHTAADSVEDRRHIGGADAIPLTLADPLIYRTGLGRSDVAARPRMLLVDIEQGWRETEPQIILSDDDSASLRLTVAEFRALVARVGSLLDVEVTA